MGYKGFIQLALRTGQYKHLAATAVFEGQLINENPLTGNTYDFSIKKSDKIIGYASLFSLTTGFVKDLYMPIEDVEKHAKRYSQSYRDSKGKWVDDFDSMARKTLIKLLLSRYGILSTELQKAIEADQSVIDGDSYIYPDNKQIEPTAEDKEEARIREYIESANDYQLLVDNCSAIS